MWQRFLIKGAEIFFKTFREAWKETATRAAEKSASGASKIGSISIKESKDILGLDSVTTESIAKKFDYLYKVNDKGQGGSPYLQAKVTNAKIRLEEALKKNEKLD
mmetsp:Transcript_13021/g.22286  ORF Transcript_13021/g.22286 Transcript_13021/m.22286 type:complete len:105 (+) Transcript_13021:14-328(+)